MVFAAWQGDFGKNEWVDWCSHQGLLFYSSVYSHPCQRARLKTDPSPSRVQIGSLLWFTPLGFFPVLPWRPAAESRAGWTKSWMDNQVEGRDFGVEADKHNRIRFGQSKGNNKQFSGSKWRWYKSKKETGIGPRLYNRRKTQMSGGGDWRSGGGKDCWVIQKLCLKVGAPAPLLLLCWETERAGEWAIPPGPTNTARDKRGEKGRRNSGTYSTFNTLHSFVPSSVVLKLDLLYHMVLSQKWSSDVNEYLSQTLHVILSCISLSDMKWVISQFPHNSARHSQLYYNMHPLGRTCTQIHQIFYFVVFFSMFIEKNVHNDIEFFYIEFAGYFDYYIFLNFFLFLFISIIFL